MVLSKAERAPKMLETPSHLRVLNKLVWQGEARYNRFIVSDDVLLMQCTNGKMSLLQCDRFHVSLDLSF